MPALKILFIDHDENSLQYLSTEAQKRGYEVFAEQTGKVGLISAWRDLPDILVVDPNMGDIPPKEFLQKLRNDRRTANCKFIAFSSLSDPQAIQDAINLDFDYYFTKEADAITALFAVLASNPPQDNIESMDSHEPKGAKPAAQLRRGKLISFLSPKGGTGTSSICANFAAVLGAKHPDKRIVAVDMVLPIGSIAQIVGYAGSLNIIHAADMPAAESSMEYFRDHLPKMSTWNMQLLAGSPSPDLADNLHIERVPIIINILLEVFDYVLVDLGRSFSKINLPIILSSDQVALILSLEKNTVALAKIVLNYLVGKGLKEDHLFPIINRAIGLGGLSKAEIEGILGINIVGTLPYAGENFIFANNHHTPLHLKFPDSSISFEFQDIVQALIHRINVIPERHHLVP